jgi:hypothetical protein
MTYNIPHEHAYDEDGCFIEDEALEYIKKTFGIIGRVVSVGPSYLSYKCYMSDFRPIDVITAIENEYISTPFGNTYGSLEIIQRDGKFYANMGDCFEQDDQEIPQYLYDALLKYTNEFES